MQASLGELIIEGVDSNIDFQMELLESAAFSDGSYSTCFLAEFLNGRTAAKAN